MTTNEERVAAMKRHSGPLDPHVGLGPTIRNMIVEARRLAFRFRDVGEEYLGNTQDSDRLHEWLNELYDLLRMVEAAYPQQVCTWSGFHATLQSIGTALDRHGIEGCTFSAVGANTLVIHRPGSRAVYLELPPDGEKLTLDALIGALEST